MGEYRLSHQAEADLLTIYKSTEEKFGQYQADAYHAGFERSFGLLADFPRMGTSADELGAGFKDASLRLRALAPRSPPARLCAGTPSVLGDFVFSRP
jgi:plasmid stabilization system protein ParE